MKSKKLLLASLILSSGVAFGYEDATDQSGMTEPPRGEADNSFVEGARPGMAETESDQRSADSRNQGSDENEQGITSTTSGNQDQSQATAGMSGEELFKRLDQDKDKNVSKYEARDHNELVQNFDELDKDNDDVLSASELENWDGLKNIEEDQ